RASARVWFIFQLVPIHRVLIDGPSVSAPMRRSWSGVFVSAPLGSIPLRSSPLRPGPWGPGRPGPPRPRSGPAPVGAEPARPFPVGDEAPLVAWCLRRGPARVHPAQVRPAQVRPLEAGAAKATPAPLGSGSTGGRTRSARPLETGAFSGLLEGSVVGADRVDL